MQPNSPHLPEGTSEHHPIHHVIQQVFQQHIEAQIQLADTQIAALAPIVAALAEGLVQGRQIWICSAPPFQWYGPYCEALLVYSHQRPALPALHIKPELHIPQLSALAAPEDMVWMLGTPHHPDPQEYLKIFQEKSLTWIGCSAGHWHFPAPWTRYQPGYTFHLPETHPLRIQEGFLVVIHAIIEAIEWQLFGISSFQSTP